MRLAAALLTAAALTSPAAAEVVDKAPGGFQTRSVVEVAAPPEKAWAALLELHRWWSPAHSYSGQAGALSFKPEAGGCFCERLTGGGVVHATVVHVNPGKLLRLSGGLGPLQADGVAASWSFTLAPSAAGTTVTQTMTAGGYRPGGLDGLAGPVDGVLTEALGRYKRYTETGVP